MFWQKHTFQNQVIWLTGASSGIGRALAVELSRRGAKMILSARSVDKLHSLAASLASESLVLPLDVTDQDANHQVVKQALAQFGKIDTAIFNAGISDNTKLDQFDAKVFERLMQVNYMSMIYGIEAVLPAIQQSDKPYLVGMSSVAGYRGLPRGEAYGASKAAMRYVLEGLRIHFRMQNKVIDVSVVCPGFVRTPLTDKNDFPMPMRIEPEQAACIIADGLERRKQHIHFPWLFSNSVRLLGLLPGSWYTALLARLLVAPLSKRSKN